jgi:sugar/nucleoside kinase (ribokinase family)
MKDAMRLADYVKLSDEEAALLSGLSDPQRAAEAIFAEYAPSLLAVTLGAEGSIGVVSADGLWAGGLQSGDLPVAGERDHAVQGSNDGAAQGSNDHAAQDIILAKAPSYDVKVVDTTGAGDGFWGAMLHRLLLLEDVARGDIMDAPVPAGVNGCRAAECVGTVDETGGGLAWGKASENHASAQSPFVINKDGLKEMLAYANAAGALAATKQGGIPAMPDDAEIRRLVPAD